MKPIDPEDSVLENWRPGVQTRMLISAQNGANQLCIFEQWVAPDTGAPAHSHPVEEILTVLAGEAEVWMDEARARLAAGQSVIVPAGRRHGFRNSGSGLCTCMRCWLHRFLKRCPKVPPCRSGGGRRFRNKFRGPCRPGPVSFV